MATISEMRTSLDWLRRHGGLENPNFVHPQEDEIQTAVDRLSEAVDQLERLDRVEEGMSEVIVIWDCGCETTWWVDEDDVPRDDRGMKNSLIRALEDCPVHRRGGD